MSTLETLIARIVEHKQRLDELKAQSPEMAEALALSDEYHGLLNGLREMCNPTPAIPQIVPMPYQVYPTPVYPLWQKWDVTCAANPLPTTLQIVK